MSLQLVIGGSGSGKSYMMNKTMIERSSMNPDSNYIVIVPEQFTMQTQKDIVSMHPNHGILNIDILSFQRLAYRVFEEVGLKERVVLDDTGKSLLLRHVLDSINSELKLFGNKKEKPGFAQEIKSALSEMYQYGVKGEDIKELAKQLENKPMLALKMEDLGSIYNKFEEFMSDNYITSEELLTLLCSVIKESGLVSKSEFYLDGFTGFTPVQYELLGLLIEHAKRVTITVTMPSKVYLNRSSTKNHDLFYLSNDTVNRLVRLADEQNIKIEQNILMNDEDSYRFNESGALRHLEANIFRYGKKLTMKEQSDISVHLCSNPLGEAEYAISEIVRLMREKQYRYRDFAIVTGDMEEYYRVLEKALTDASVPYFIDHKHNIISNPFVEALRAVLEIVDKDYSYESIFTYLRCGMSNFSKTDIDILENYVISLGVRGHKRWSNEWKKSYRHFNIELLPMINEMRQAVVDSLEPMRKIIKDKKSTAFDYIKALYEFQISQGMQDRLSVYGENFKNAGDIALYKEYSQTYKTVIELFDKIVDLIGDERINIRDFRNVLDEGFREIKVGIIPPGNDQLMVGDIERTRLKDVKVMFFLGVNEGIVPKNGVKKSILTDSDRTQLKTLNMELSPTARENSFIQKFYLYLNMTKPSQKLYITYANTKSDGTSARPSYIINEMYKLFGENIFVNEISADNETERIASFKNAVKYIADNISHYSSENTSTEFKQVYSYLFADEVYRKKLFRLIDAAFYRGDRDNIGTQAAMDLYGGKINNSITRMEKYASCAYSHFLSYGLALAERKQYQIDAADLGNIYHSAIEKCSKKINEIGIGWDCISDKLRHEIVDNSVKEVTDEYGNTILNSSARNQYMINRITRVTDRTIWALSKHIEAGKFKPQKFEQEIITDTNGIYVKGKIDRIDTFEEDSNLYVRIIDYKTGAKKFSIKDIYYGLSLQLVVYMKAAMELLKRENPDKCVIPAGIFYYNINDPIVDKTDSDENLEKAVLKELKLSGIAGDTEDIYTAIDSSLSESGNTSNVFQASITKNGKLDSRSKTAPRDQLFGVMEYADNMIKEFDQDISDGHIEVNPYVKGNFKPCDYCDYKGVCGFDTKISGFEYRKLSNMNDKDAWAKIMQENNSDNSKMLDITVEKGDIK